MMSDKSSFAGIKINAFTVTQLNEIVKIIADSDSKSIIANHNLHSLYLFHKDKKMREFYSQADYVHIDGMPIVLLGKMFKQKLTKANRITYVDWFESLMMLANQNEWKVYFLGSTESTGNKVENIMKIKYSNVQFRYHNGFFDITNKQINQSILDEINQFKPHIFFVGMGMPRQEKWILENYEQLQANVVLQSGACMDYVAGEVPTPPRWMGQFGVEWLFRLFGEPRRLWKRYLLEPIFLFPIILRQFYKR